MTASERVFDSPPGLLQLFARAGAAMIPGASRLPFVVGGGGGGSAGIPTHILALNDVSVSREKLSAYQRVCGFALSNTLPPTFPHILAFPLHLALMTDPGFPFGPIGLVHVANAITQRRPIDASEKLSLRVRATQLEPHPRGEQFSIHTEASVDGEAVWEEVSTNLRRGGRSGSSGETKRSAEEPIPATATWRLDGDLGRRYASISGDINPIHLHPLTARPFGFPSAIAHGMWTKARCLAALAIPDAFTVEVAFKKPILLPATVSFGERGGRFEVREAKTGAPHLEGSLR